MEIQDHMRRLQTLCCLFLEVVTKILTSTLRGLTVPRGELSLWRYWLGSIPPERKWCQSQQRIEVDKGLCKALRRRKMFLDIGPETWK
jgi:hypothetical protein